MKIFTEKSEEGLGNVGETYLRLVAEFDSTYLVVVDDKGSIVPGGFLLRITDEEGFLHMSGVCKDIGFPLTKGSAMVKALKNF
jgi:hypothetical protein